MKVGVTIKNLRTQREETLTAFAESVGISKSFLSEIENEKKNPDLETLQRICAHLQIPVYVFFYEHLKGEEKLSKENKELLKDISPILDRLIKNIG